MAAEILEPVVVDAQHLVGRFGVADPRGDAEDAEDDLGIDPVAVHVLDPLIGVAGTAHAPLAVFIEAGLGHLVDTVVLARDEFPADRAGAADETHLDPGLGDPARPVGAVLDKGHAVLQLAFRLRDEQLRRQPRQVEVTIGRNSFVLHPGRSPLVAAF